MPAAENNSAASPKACPPGGGEVMEAVTTGPPSPRGQELLWLAPPSPPLVLNAGWLCTSTDAPAPRHAAMLGSSIDCTCWHGKGKLKTQPRCWGRTRSTLSLTPRRKTPVLNFLMVAALRGSCCRQTCRNPTPLWEHAGKRAEKNQCQCKVWASNQFLSSPKEIRFSCEPAPDRDLLSISTNSQFFTF